MALKEELGLKTDFASPAHEALLNIYYTASIMKKRADDFFGQFGLTDVQFNLMNLLYYESGKEGGLSQAQISDMMLVNRANITSLVDRMEKAELVSRTAHANDRRYNIIKLTSKGKNLYTKVEPHYLKQVKEAMTPLDAAELKRMAGMLEKVRRTLRV
ncbi:MAG: MarR family transcriptional regulator [Sedimentisphaerales bacterium]|jgi:DNA-binding MarR family transcriptional regulator